jgi:hypothetical protein
MNNRYFQLLNAKGLASEDDTSFALAELVRTSVNLRHIFLRFLFARVPPHVSAAAEHLIVKPQYSFSGSSADVQSLGTIDLALVLPREDTIIGVEFKVRDREKPARLKNYRIVMDSGFSGPNWLFEIVQRPEHAIETTIVDRILTWNDLHEHLSRNLDDVGNARTRGAVTDYLEFLSVSKTILSHGITLRRKPRNYPGVPDDSICRDLFLALAKRLPFGIISSVESDKNVPPQLRLGRENWGRQFGMLWLQRIWLDLRIEPTTGNYFVRSSIIFHNANFTKFDYPARMFPFWAELCRQAGFDIWRGPAKGWDGKKGMQMHPPWVLDCRPKYFGAQEAEPPLLRAAAKADGSREWLFDDVLNRLPTLLDLVDKFPSR